MNNEELKKKIVDILQLKLQECPLQPHGIMYRDAAEYIADALIAAGIRFGENLTATFDRMALEREHELERHLAEAEQLKNQYSRALLNLARRYVVKTNMTLPHGDEPHSRSTDIEILALYIIANECEQAEKELAEEGKDEN